MADAARSAGVSVHTVPDSQAAIELLRESLRPADIILIKASHAMGLSAVVAALDEPT
jgi:UDP-N-acetylmuramoyl-tripeptide--D-alanyl-D-alanine ligase